MDMENAIDEYLRIREATEKGAALEGRYEELVSVKQSGDNLYEIVENDSVKGIRYSMINSETQEIWYGY